MLSRIQQVLNRLRNDTSGNATLLVAAGMPALIGSAGIAVDFSQWYMWKRELQYAADQAAIAGAWAKAEPLSALQYSSRAEQEFDANLSQLTAMSPTKNVSLADWGGGTQNSVLVTSSTSSTLPFTNFILGSDVTVSVTAQATFEAATNFTTCLLALHPSASAAFELGGNASGTVSCGGGALSTSDTAVVKNGSPSAQLGYLVSSGGIDSGFASNGTINEYISNLEDPFDSLSPPASPTPQSYTCPTTGGTSGTSTTADVTTTITYTYTYWQGKNQNSASTQVTYAGGRASYSTTTTDTGETVPDGSTNGNQGAPSYSESWTGNNWAVAGSRNDEIYEKEGVATQLSYSNVTQTGTGTGTGSAIAYPQPGTYSSISIACDTQFAPGVYVVTGDIDFGQNKTVTGSDVMFVLQNAGAISINSNSVLNLSGITATTLQNSYGVSAEDAAKMDGMLIFDPSSREAVTLNGGANIALDGIVYMPNRAVTMNGTSTVGGGCLMIASSTLKFTGTNDLSSFCLPANQTGFEIGGTTVQVRLVA